MNIFRKLAQLAFLAIFMVASQGAIMFDPYRFVGPATLTYIQTSVDTTDTATRSFASVSFGTESSERIIIFYQTCYVSTSTAIAVTGTPTIGGVNATQAVAATTASTNRIAGSIWYANVPTGTSGTIAFNTTNSSSNCGIAVWSMTGSYASSTPVVTASDITIPNAGDQADVNVNTTTGDFIIAVTGANRGTDRTYTWTGVTEDFDADIQTTEQTFGGGHFTAVSSETPRTVHSVASGDVNSGVALAATWR